MAGKPDASQIGADRTVQDPQDAMKREEGVYKDGVEAIPVQNRTLGGALPQGPDKAPFVIKGGTT